MVSICFNFGQSKILLCGNWLIFRQEASACYIKNMLISNTALHPLQNKPIVPNSKVTINILYHNHILGASSGIGAGTAILFSQLGAKLAITGRNEENLKKTVDQCNANSVNKV